MSAFERLLAIADEETLDLARAMIGKPELALPLAKEALKWVRLTARGCARRRKG
jgi:hypothetical protein